MALEDQLPLLYARRRFGIKPGVERVAQMLERLGNPHKSYSTIHVVGTNGKGSTSSFLSSILTSAGYRTALFTSPHLVTFNERFRINNHEISDQKLSELIFTVLSVASDEATFFEIVTAMAAQYFADENVDVAIMEAGMGGRSDATAALQGTRTLLTPVSLDHTDYLGITEQAIAIEKIAIAMPDSQIFIGKQMDGVRNTILDWCTEKRFSPVWLQESVNSNWNDDDSFNYMSADVSLHNLVSGIGGVYQKENAGLALLTAEYLRRDGWQISEDDLRRGIADASWSGRMEFVPGNPPLMLDGAHNVAGMAAMAGSLNALKGYSRFLVVIGVMADKDVPAMISSLPGCVTAFYCVTPQVERAMDAELLKNLFDSLGRQSVACGSVENGIVRAKADAGPDELIIVCGSLFTVGEAKAWLAGKPYAGVRG